MALTTSRASLQLLRRSFSSGSIKPAVGTIKRRANPAQLEQTELAHEGEITFVTPETHMKNAAMATGLFSFAVGVAYYSMNAVGQAGSDEETDPLALLKHEAAQAQVEQRKEEKQTGDANEMLKQFQAGDFDPDKYEELDEEKPKRAWWKFW